MEWLVNPNDERTTWLYDAVGRPTTITYGNTSLAETDYDAAGRITNASQVGQVAYRYRAFGEQTVESGSGPNRFTYVGKSGYYRQPDLGNYWLRERVCEDGGGRFVSTDPAEEGVNVYRYIGDRLLVLAGPSGGHAEEDLAL